MNLRERKHIERMLGRASRQACRPALLNRRRAEDHRSKDRRRRAALMPWGVAEDTWRDWFSVPELEQLRDLLPATTATFSIASFSAVDWLNEDQ
jgi:hypothetical protein